MYGANALVKKKGLIPVSRVAVSQKPIEKESYDRISEA